MPLFRSRLKSLVKRALKSEEATVGSSPREAYRRAPTGTRTSPSETRSEGEPVVSAPEAREPPVTASATRFAALASAAAEGTLDLREEVVAEVVNESSESSDAGQVLTIDQDECISCGTCVENSDPNFFLPSEGPGGEEAKAEVIAQEGHWGHVQDAIDACPVMCIGWLDADEVGPNHSGGRSE